MKIFCVHLERATERKELIQKEWIENLKLDITFWKAYDRKLIEENLFVYPYSETFSLKKINRKLNTGEIACATSFLQLFEHCLSENINEVIVMEDDVIPLINNKEILFSRIENAKKEYNVEMILLHKVYTKNPNLLVYLDYLKYSSLCPVVPWGNLMFYITSQGMKTILNNTKKIIYMPADHFQKKLGEMNLVSILNEPVCELYFINSYIGNEFRLK